MTSLSLVVCFAFWLLVLFGVFVVYKLLDRLIRILRIGNYSDRYILVTGCDSGFGNLLAKRLDKLGCHMFAGCLTEKGETDLKKVSSNRLHTISLDVRNQESIRMALKYVKSKLPEGRGLWGVLNNAGINIVSGPIEWMKIDDMKHTCDVNLWGVIQVTIEFLPLVKRERGRVVNTASVLGRTSHSMGVPYSISKYGVEAFTDGLRRSLYPFECKAILVEPGYFKTPLTSGENAVHSIIRAWEGCLQEVKDEYGQVYFDTIRTKLVGQITDSCSNRTSDVVDVYEHALLGRFPRARYVVGNDAKFLFLPVQAMPEWIGDWIYRRLMDLPLPESVRKRQR